jgi:hypothetical protein
VTLSENGYGYINMEGVLIIFSKHNGTTRRFENGLLEYHDIFNKKLFYIDKTGREFKE